MEKPSETNLGRPDMNSLQETRRLRRIREVEGYLDLILSASSQLSATFEAKRTVALRAISLLDEIDELDGSSSDTLYLRGQTYRTLDEHDKAIECLRQVCDDDPADIHVWLALGWSYKRLGRLDLAIEALEEAMCQDPAQPIIHYNLACYWALAKNIRLSLEYLAQACEINSSFRELVGNEPDFDAIRNDPEFIGLLNLIA
ncbi:tetratricopeptide repeat protein [Blastopirellula sp. JC732]|uniref:Tetratricopeptide repeat protein n=1 Tax=Blastopirellula sediminis TaxID=2894196 RepID=A0A9X1SKK9_9BACT|nr:tetratricopeptide repeat protein [Blastopirellula sediminis]MCC9606840.1 tetratricopeptide repeat protein [Blastopirellula sediminis]MCC9629864.1 tetratricopeptide repeat protein [Blastopirellula sediminis]